MTVNVSLGCARCGACCQRIPLSTPLEQLVQNWAEGRYEHDPRTREDVVFMAAHWTALPDDPGVYACDQFDLDTGTCLVQDSKPPVCRDYPWYGDGPTPQRAGALDPQCSYLLDVPPDARPAGAYPLIPVEVIR